MEPPLVIEARGTDPHDKKLIFARTLDVPQAKISFFFCGDEDYL